VHITVWLFWIGYHTCPVQCRPLCKLRLAAPPMRFSRVFAGCLVTRLCLHLCCAPVTCLVMCAVRHASPCSKPGGRASTTWQISMCRCSCEPCTKAGHQRYATLPVAQYHPTKMQHQQAPSTFGSALLQVPQNMHDILSPHAEHALCHMI
jgi:hypothetical protein